MKKVNLILAIILLAVMTGCRGEIKQSTDDFIIVDVMKSYPEKELILQDFMDVEYIVLETTDEFLTQGIVKAIGKEIILVTNRGNDGDIFVFDRTGKGLRKINRKGQGGEEYLQTTGIVLDENNNEMFIIVYSARKILVYDLYGNFKRNFNFTDSAYYSNVYNYDRDNLICYKSYIYPVNDKPSRHLIIAKQDGSITQEIKIPVTEIKTPTVIMENAYNGEAGIVNTWFYPTIPYHGNWVLVEASSDTVYNYLPDETIRPHIVRIPSIHSTDPEVFLRLNMLTDRYDFMQTFRKEFDFSTMRGFPSTDLVYDKQENALFKYTMYNDDYSNRRQVYLSSNPPVNHEIAIWQSLEAYQLVEAYVKNELKGPLKEIAAELDEEDNPVIMLVKHKKILND